MGWRTGLHWPCPNKVFLHNPMLANSHSLVLLCRHYSVDDVVDADESIARALSGSVLVLCRGTVSATRHLCLLLHGLLHSAGSTCT